MKKLMNYKLLQKAYEIDFSKIEEGYLACEQMCYAKNKNKARSVLFKAIKYDDWKLKLYPNDEVNYLNIPIRRCKSADKYEFENKEMTMNQIENTLYQRKRIDELDLILNDENIKYCFIMKRGYYYRPNSQGYTSHEYDAGIYTKEEAVSHAKSCEELHINPINIEKHNKMINNKIAELNTKIIS